MKPRSQFRSFTRDRRKCLRESDDSSQLKADSAYIPISEPAKREMLPFPTYFCFLIWTISQYSFALDVDTNPDELLHVITLQQKLALNITRSKINITSNLQQPCSDFLDLIGKRNGSSLADIVGHPINLLILYNHWEETRPSWNMFVAASSAGQEREQAEDLLSHLPHTPDLMSVALAVLRLQSVYNLRAEDLLRGDVRGHKSLRGLNKEECFLLTKVAASSLMKSELLEWHNLCMVKFVSYDLEVAARGASLAASLATLNEALESYRNGSQEAESLRESLPIDLVERVTRSAEDDAPSKGPEAISAPSTNEGTELLDAYRRLCRLQFPATSLLPIQERCILYDNRRGGDRLSPLHLEFHAYDPLVVTIHDALSGEAVDQLVQEAAQGGLSAPKSVASLSGEVRNTGGRTGRVGFLQTSADLRAVFERLTGLSLASAEPLQLVSYGVGGHYEPHVDYYGSSGPARQAFGGSGLLGDRMATLLLYLNDVKEGGATAFPRLGLAVRPERGAALMWYNLYRGGEGDADTMHAGCPVLVGAKWVANQWFGERGQEGRRPCSLQRDV